MMGLKFLSNTQQFKKTMKERLLFLIALVFVVALIIIQIIIIKINLEEIEQNKQLIESNQHILKELTRE
jgi:hypothetical protein